jgi:hypothetical protein
MVSQTNALGIFQEGRWYISHVYLSLPSAVPFSKALEGNKSYNFTEMVYGQKITSKFMFD